MYKSGFCLIVFIINDYQSRVPCAWDKISCTCWDTMHYFYEGFIDILCKYWP